MNDLVLFAISHDRSHTKTLIFSKDLIQFQQNLYSTRERECEFYNLFELENSFSSKSQNGGEKSTFRKNRSKVGERAHVDTENRTMKSAQHDFWSYLYFGSTGCIIVNIL